MYWLRPLLRRPIKLNFSRILRKSFWNYHQHYSTLDVDISDPIDGDNLMQSDKIIPPGRYAEISKLYDQLGPVTEQIEPNEYLFQLASFEKEDLDELIGPRNIRATRMEAVVRMMADLFAIYDDQDTDLLDSEMRFEFGEGKDINEDSIMNVETPDMSGSLVSEEEHLLEYLKSSPESRATGDNANSNVSDKSDETISDSFFESAKKTNNNLTLDDYIELQAGSGALRYQAQNADGGSAALIHYMRTYHNDLLKGVSMGLLSADGLPNLKNFNYMIRQLTVYQYTKPAQLAINCLILSEIPLSPQTWVVGLRVSIASGSLSNFVRLARLVDLSDTANDSIEAYNAKTLERLSSAKPEPWLAVRHDRSESQLRQRFFGKFNPDYDQDMSLFNVLIEGFYRFRLYSHIDTVLRYILAKGYPLNAPILTLNFRAAAQSKDSIRANWTWTQTKQLLLVEESEVDNRLIKAAKVTAKRLEDNEMLLEAQSFRQDNKMQQAEPRSGRYKTKIA